MVVTEPACPGLEARQSAGCGVTGVGGEEVWSESRPLTAGTGGGAAAGGDTVLVRLLGRAGSGAVRLGFCGQSPRFLQHSSLRGTDVILPVDELPGGRSLLRGPVLRASVVRVKKPCN